MGACTVVLYCIYVQFSRVKQRSKGAKELGSPTRAIVCFLVPFFIFFSPFSFFFCTGAWIEYIHKSSILSAESAECGDIELLYHLYLYIHNICALCKVRPRTSIYCTCCLKSAPVVFIVRACVRACARRVE